MPTIEKFEEVPEEVQNKLRELAQKFKLSLEDVFDEYLFIFNSDHVQNMEFKDELSRHIYAYRALKVHLLTMPPVKKFVVIPIGFSDVRITKKGQKRVVIFAIVVQPGKKPEMKRIIAQDRYTEIVNDLELFAKYEVKLGETRYGDLIVDSRTRFDEPEFLDIEPLELLKSLGIPIIKIAEAAEKRSLRGSDGYLIETDWRGIRGIIARKVIGKRKDGTDYGVYIVGDDSIDIDFQSETGRFSARGFPVFCPVQQMKYAEFSECYFFGTIDIDQRTKEPFMNCYLVLPVHAVEEEELW